MARKELLANVRRFQPNAPAEGTDFEACWDLLREALRDIHNKNCSRLSFEELYRAAYKIVLKKKGEELYDRVTKFEEQWFAENVIPKIELLVSRSLINIGDERGAGTSINERRQTGEKFLKGLRDTWEDHNMSMNMTADILMYLDRGFTQADPNRSSIFATTIALLVQSTPAQANIQLQKVFLTAATLKLVSKHNGLNQLFKTAISGLPAIISLLGLWLCFFFFFAIMFVEIFGLTKWGYIGPETYAKNFSSLPLTLIFLSMMTTGEGWNGYMHDYTVEPPQCTPSANYLETDCGSTGWAYFLFIAWNVTSMYIFLNSE